MGSESTSTAERESSLAPSPEADNRQETMIVDRDAIAEARDLAKRIHRSADILLERLLSHLTQFPEIPATTGGDDEDLLEKDSGNDRIDESEKDNHEEERMMLKRGLTIPVSAVVWLSDQLDSLDRLQKEEQTPELALASEAVAVENEEECQTHGSNHYGNCDLEPWLGAEAAKSLRYRLNLLRFLLPRAQLIRLARQSWPPRSSSTNDAPSFLCSSSSPKQRLKQWWKKRQRGSSNESEDADSEARASRFLRYTARLEHGASNCVNLWRVFPNATVLILESVPPSWIDLKGRAPDRTPSTRNLKQPALRLISVANAAIYDLKDFLPPVSSGLPFTATSLPPFMQSPVSHSLTHLKLDNCSLGELTKGFASSLGQLTHLEYLSLKHNQFRSAKTLLKGLRPLTRLKYLDVSANQLVGCFGPYANLCLGGQVRTLKLSNNQLETCFNSGLEKCYGLRELWLDGNNIQDVVEVSGLARLPDLQCLALQRNPFSSKKNSSKFLLQSSSYEGESLTHQNTTSSHQDNSFYDPLWKIRLWTWFQHERRALTPLELPLLNKKTKNLGFSHNGCDAAIVGRMTREEWDRIQEESFSVATTVATVSTVSTMMTASSPTNTVLSVEESQLAVIAPLVRASAHPTKNSLALVEPVRNRKVTKKSKTRQAKIHTSENKSNGATSFQTIRSQRTNRSRKRRQKGKNSELVGVEQNPHASNKDTHDNEKELPPRVSNELQNYSPELKIQQLSFSLQDVLVSIHHEHRQQYHPADIESEEAPAAASSDDNGNNTDQDTTEKMEKESLTMEEGPVECAAENDVPNNPFLEDDFSQDEAVPKNHNSKETEDEKPNIQKREEEERIKETEGDGDGEASELNSPEGGENNNVDVSMKDEEKPDESDDLQKSKTTNEASKSPKSSPKRSPRRTPRKSPRRPEPIDEDRIFVRPKVASVKLGRMGNYKPFDALSSDWDDVIKKASEGRIPDGLLKSPVEEPSNDYGMKNDLFSDEAADLLDTGEPSNAAAAKSADQTSGSHSTTDPTQDPSLSSNNRLANTLPEHVWQDDSSVLSSLGASRDDVLPRRVNKFQLAEENCAYDGPDSSRGMKVVENLQLYFESFVFPTSMPDIPVDVLEEMEEDQDDWQLVAMYYPRIQLWPDDRHLLELERVRISTSMHSSADWTTSRERFLRVWEEDIVPCGKPAMRRLPPNRRNRLGFHGDKLFKENADVDAYAECRKVLLCLSSKAFYVILEKDDVTKSHQQQSNKRRFPLPLDRGDRFRDAPWPHAVARHSLADLEAICIGFEFQRLTLRFRNQSLPKSDPFVYVLLTGDKRSSVRIFQEIQKLAKDLGDSNGVSKLGKNSSTIEIENDSQIVLDSLHNVFNNTESSAEQSIGTIMHFQVVQQQWKHGDRGTVRRVCVITDTKILLLDEDYAADGHDLSSVTVKGKNMADARYRPVDHAALNLVSQVQAANADPRAITIIINPSALSRTKRWRLICRDREGAERLVDDARKALEDI